MSGKEGRSRENWRCSMPHCAKSLVSAFLVRIGGVSVLVVPARTVVPLVAHLVNQETIYILGILGVRFAIIVLKQSVQIAARLGFANGLLLAFCLHVYNFHSNNRIDVNF